MWLFGYFMLLLHIDSVRIFVCRSGTAVFNSTTLSPYDIDLYRFVVPSSSFASAKDNPANAGFCTPFGHCMGSGVLNVSTCQIGTLEPCRCSECFGLYRNK